MNNIKVTTSEIKQQIAEAYSKRVSKFPRCNCRDDKHLATKWKKDAELDTCKFIIDQFGMPIQKLDATDRRTLNTKCMQFLPKNKAKMLQSNASRRSTEFYAKFCAKKNDTKQLTDKQSLAFLRTLNLAFSEITTIKDIANVSYTKLQRIRSNSIVFARLSMKVKEAILNHISACLKAKNRKTRKKFTPRSSFDPSMSVSDAEELVLIKNRDEKNMKFNEETGRLEGNTVAWRRISRVFGTKLPQAFIDKYAVELTKKKPGRKKAQNVLKIAGEEPRKKKSRVKKIKKEVEEHLEKKAKVVEDTINKPAPIVPVKMITDPEAMRTFINTTMKKHDITYPLSTEISRWSNPEWSMVDAYRDSIAPALLQSYADKIKQARSILGTKSGGAYASIRDNRQLAVAHIVTSWICGDLV